MRLITFTHAGSTSIGAVVERGGREIVVDFARSGSNLPGDMLDFLEGGASALHRAEDAIVRAGDDGIALADVQVHAPVPRPGKIFCVGLNYRDHAEENNEPIPAYPTIFAKYWNTVVGPGAAIQVPSITEKVDFEGEVGVIIGRRGRDIPEAEALKYVAGYVPFNDVTARDYQARTSQWTLGKSFDTFGPMGPYLVTTDDIPNPHTLDLRLSVDGEVMQQSNTRNLIFTIPFLIAYISSAVTLEPGDLISTGTPGGVGAARKPPRFLQPGQTVRLEISGLGVLENPITSMP